ncbi:thiamine diphosphokinase [Mucilaginibacter pallidiroseus]|uniref:thiamine diphosphokinase n=1 Tax=Mucilaginibacter pallidiroseus TaxID=2599295 RepID=UPI001645E2E5|nr:thiamine diphosphokinase [Mucilaginibacter pallidiroseus]
MSSHHIVREKQEPALLILSLDDFDEEQLGQLLEWSPTVITTPITAELLDAIGIKVDVVMADELEEILQSDIKLVPTDGRATAKAAMHYLLSNGYPAVNIITDEVDIETFAAFATQINIVVFSGNRKIFAINSGFSKWKPAGERMEILSEASDLMVAGAQPIGERRYLTQHDGFVTFTFNSPYLFIAEEI